MGDLYRRVKDVGHFYRFGHFPDWVAHVGVPACVKCTKGGHRLRIPQLVPVPQGF